MAAVRLRTAIIVFMTFLLIVFTPSQTPIVLPGFRGFASRRRPGIPAAPALPPKREVRLPEGSGSPARDRRVGRIGVQKAPRAGPDRPQTPPPVLPTSRPGRQASRVSWGLGRVRLA